jgi:putative phosphoesterase
MIIGILSDTHSRRRTVAWALDILRDRGVATVLHCGDIEDEATVELFRGFDAHFVYGNCDVNREVLGGAMAAIGATLHEPFGNLDLEGRKLAFLHGDDSRMLRDLENSGYFDYLFHGHTHQANEYQVGPTRVINPGALHRANPKSFILLDLTSGQVESIVAP